MAKAIHVYHFTPSGKRNMYIAEKGVTYGVVKAETANWPGRVFILLILR
jgi:hypothetical protein